MKAIIVFACALLFCTVQSFAQNRECATMEVLQQQIQQNPNLEQTLDSMETAIRAEIEARGKTESYADQNLPLIPGFTPTGDSREDARNFAAAKKELFAKDPELYRQLTRNPTPNNQKKTKK